MERDTQKIQCDRKNSQYLNETLSYKVLKELSLLGVKHYCLCPGGRNTCFIDLISGEFDCHTYLHYDERSAGFFALGKIMATHEPCAVVVTSGTAVGELLPSVMEAYYSRLPLIIISADRPKRFRGSGAPQTAEQQNIFGLYTPHCEDLEAESLLKLNEWDAMTPCHLNLCFEEAYETDYSRFPDIQPGQFIQRTLKQDNQEMIDQFFDHVEHPLVIVGALSQVEAEIVKPFLLNLEAPCILEGHSRLRNDPDLQIHRLDNPDGILKKESFDGILRLGGVPTTKLWRDTEYLQDRIRLLSVSQKPFTGSSWGSLIHTDLSFLSLSTLSKKRILPKNGFCEYIQSLFNQYPRAEASVIFKISTLIPDHARIFLGNSLPIREWDLFSTTNPGLHDVFSVRGLNGIDGQISTFFGLLHPDKHTIGIIGDLTALYDMSAPFVLKNCAGQFTLFIINNGGGKIFQKLFKNPMIQNCHSLGFQHWAKMFDLSYRLVDSSDLDQRLLNYNVVEVIPCEDESLKFNRDLLK